MGSETCVPTQTTLFRARERWRSKLPGLGTAFPCVSTHFNPWMTVESLKSSRTEFSHYEALAPRSRKEALIDDNICLSVVSLSHIREACTTATKSINVKI